MASADDSVALTVDDSERYQLPGTVAGQCTFVVRVEDPSRRPVLRLRRYLARLTGLSYRDLGPDGTEPGRDTPITPTADPETDTRRFDFPVDLAPGAVAREFRLRWVLDPRDHESIGREGGEMLLVRPSLLTHDGGVEQVSGQGLIIISWVEAETLLSIRSSSSSTPEPLRSALAALLRGERPGTPNCGACRQEFDLARLRELDDVWEHSAGPQWEWLRSLLVRRALRRPPGTWRYDTTNQHHRLGSRPQHVDVREELDAARTRHRERLLACAPPAVDDALPPG
jgi:hypothetical protein